jgi:hypothetical protein
MTRLRLTVDGETAQEVWLSREDTTIGRAAGNDIVIDHLAVSSRHAVLQARPGELWIEDLKSTNGTYVNGQAVTRRRLSDGDVIEIGKMRIEVSVGDATALSGAGLPGPRADDRFVDTTTPERSEPARRGPSHIADADAYGDAPAAGVACIRVLNGAAAGREVLLARERTTIGKPGVLVVAIERVAGSHLISLVEGMRQPTVNGRPLSGLGLSLGDGDVIELVGTRILFIAPRTQTRGPT